MSDGLLIDTDPGLGVFGCDVDDALAIHFLVSAGVKIDGLTSCFGNSDIDTTTRVARQLGERWDTAVYRGAAGPGDVQTAAVDALVAHTGTVLAIAPMTNIAAALDRGAHWERLVLLGGTARRMPNLRYLHTTELNFALDEEAAATALASCDVLFPMEVCRQVLFGADELALLPAWLAEGCAAWLRIAPLMTGRRAFHPWDVLPALWLVDPSPFRTERRGVVCAGIRGWRGRIRYVPGAVEVAFDVNAERYHRVWSEVVRRDA